LKNLGRETALPVLRYYFLLRVEDRAPMSLQLAAIPIPSTSKVNHFAIRLKFCAVAAMRNSS
jgi:hypothetical protein